MSVGLRPLRPQSVDDTTQLPVIDPEWDTYCHITLVASSGDRHHGYSGDDPREWDIQTWRNFYIGAWGALFSDILGPGERNYFFRRYFGTVELDPQRASTQMGTILEEILGHLNATGATVSLSLEVTAEHPTRFPDRKRKIVEKKTVDLKFSQSSFEEE